jgi:hypothetical protein
MASLKAQRLLPIVTSKSIKPIKYQINQINQIRYDVNGTKFSYCTAASSYQYGTREVAISTFQSPFGIRAGCVGVLGALAQI